MTKEFPKIREAKFVRISEFLFPQGAETVFLGWLRDYSPCSVQWGDAGNEYTLISPDQIKKWLADDDFWEERGTEKERNKFKEELEEHIESAMVDNIYLDLEG